MLGKIVFILVKYKNKTAIVACVILVLMIVFSKPLVFDGNLSGFYLKDNPYHRISMRMGEVFSADEKIFILIEPDSASSQKVFQSLRKLENKLTSALPGINVQSIHKASPLFRFKMNGQDSIHEILTAASQIPMLKDLIGRDNGSFLVINHIPPEVHFNLDTFNQIIDSRYSGIKKLTAISQYHIQNEIENSLIKDLIILSCFTLIFLIIFIALVYHRISTMVYLLINVLAAFIPVLFFFSVFNIKVNLITVLVIPIVFVLSLADAIHLLTGYDQITPKGDKRIQIHKTMRFYFIPSLLTSVTTAIAFFSFLFNESEYIRQFGLLTSICVLFEFVITFLVASFLLHFVKQEYVPNKIIAGSVGFFLRNQKSFSFGLLALLFVSVFFISGISFKTNFDNFLPVNSQVYYNNKKFIEKFSSLLEMDLFIEENHGQNEVSDLKNKGDLQQITLEFSKELNNFRDVVSVQSIRDQLEYESRYNVMGINLFKFPVTNNPYVSKDQKIYRINVKFSNPENVKVLERKISDAFKKYEPDQRIIIYSPVLLMDYINTRIAKSLLKSMLFSAFLIFLILFALTRSFGLTLISMVTNLIPLGCLVLILNIFNLDINILTSITGVVCLGLIVDDTIHVLYRKLKLSVPLNELAFGILNTSLILCIGFLVYILSSFNPTRVFGYTSSVVFLVTVISDLTVLPWLMKKWQAFKEKGHIE